MKETSISEKKQQQNHNLEDKTVCQKCNVSVTVIAKLVPANFSISIFTKFKNPNLSKASNKVLKKLGSSNLLVFFRMLWELLHLTPIHFFVFLCLYGLYVYLHGKKTEWYMHINP